MEEVAIYTVGLTLAVFLLYFIGVAIAPHDPDSVKNDHFECGLPASSDQPRRANYGFFAYAIFFVVADMTGLFFALFVYDLDRRGTTVAALFALLVAVAVSLAMWQMQRSPKGNA
ncbi:NADH-quinone oxidoreductase subunit A [Nitratifractor sp.]